MHLTLFKQLAEEHYEILRQSLVPELPRSRRIVETLNLCSRGCSIFSETASFFIPKDEDPLAKLSGIVVATFPGDEKHYKTTTHALAYFSKKEDAEKVGTNALPQTPHFFNMPFQVHKMLESCLDWRNAIIKFESISDWHVHGLKKLIQSMGKMYYFEPCPQWEKQADEVHAINEISTLTSKNGETLVVKRLSKEHASTVNGHWKFRDESSFSWVQSQCERGLAFGVFPPASDDNPIAWIIAYR